MDNATLAQKLKDLRDFLIIAGYDESHATRYTHIARFIEKLPESVETMRREGRLRELPGVGELVAMYIKEILEDGVSSKQLDWEKEAPISVLEMIRVPGLGAKTAKRLYWERRLASLAGLQEAVRSGALDDFAGLGPKLKEAILATKI